MLADQGALQERDLEQIDLPIGLNAILNARLDRLESAGTGRARARRDRGRGVPPRRSRRAVRAGRAQRRPGAARGARRARLRAPRDGELRRRRRVSVQASARPRGRVPRDREEATSDAPRGVRRSGWNGLPATESTSSRRSSATTSSRRSGSCGELGPTGGGGARARRARRRPPRHRRPSCGGAERLRGGREPDPAGAVARGGRSARTCPRPVRARARAAPDPPCGGGRDGAHRDPRRLPCSWASTTWRRSRSSSAPGTGPVTPASHLR